MVFFLNLLKIFSKPNVYFDDINIYKNNLFLKYIIVL